MLRSIAKFGIDVPISGSYGVAQDLPFTTAPYEAAKNFVGVNCYTPPTRTRSHRRRRSWRSRRARSTASRTRSLAQTNYALGWVNGMIIVAGPEEHQGDGHAGLDEGGPREGQEPQHGRPLADDHADRRSATWRSTGAAGTPTTGPRRRSCRSGRSPSGRSTSRTARPLPAPAGRRPASSRHPASTGARRGAGSQDLAPRALWGVARWLRVPLRPGRTAGRARHGRDGRTAALHRAHRVERRSDGTDRGHRRRPCSAGLQGVHPDDERGGWRRRAGRSS